MQPTKTRKYIRETNRMNIKRIIQVPDDNWLKKKKEERQGCMICHGAGLYLTSQKTKAVYNKCECQKEQERIK